MCKCAINNARVDDTIDPSGWHSIVSLDRIHYYLFSVAQNLRAHSLIKFGLTHSGLSLSTKYPQSVRVLLRLSGQILLFFFCLSFFLCYDRVFFICSARLVDLYLQIVKYTIKWQCFENVHICEMSIYFILQHSGRITICQIIFFLCREYVWGP